MSSNITYSYALHVPKPECVVTKEAIALYGKELKKQDKKRQNKLQYLEKENRGCCNEAGKAEVTKRLCEGVKRHMWVECEWPRQATLDAIDAFEDLETKYLWYWCDPHEGFENVDPQSNFVYLIRSLLLQAMVILVRFIHQPATMKAVIAHNNKAILQTDIPIPRLCDAYILIKPAVIALNHPLLGVATVMLLKAFDSTPCHILIILITWLCRKPGHSSLFTVMNSLQ
ncbi:hypothetical protein PISL3812_05679 [Talaromyces islandicus]|uniref:Uncharacterized protein n=1 Tax=Talaromyces islandicus TaxID=28573 RepID=A0A0U1LZ96_TALIS|nr:hypothetical protein PISL3812_05679 [Talaromyces islandicus]